MNSKPKGKGKVVQQDTFVVQGFTRYYEDGTIATYVWLDGKRHLVKIHKEESGKAPMHFWQPVEMPKMGEVDNV